MSNTPGIFNLKPSLTGSPRAHALSVERHVREANSLPRLCSEAGADVDPHIHVIWEASLRKRMLTTHCQEPPKLAPGQFLEPPVLAMAVQL